MINKPIFDYYFFGTSLRYLQDAQAGWNIHNAEEDMYVLGNVKAFLRRLDDVGLKITKRASSDLTSFAQTLEQSPTGSTISVEQAVRLRLLITQIRPTLEAELHEFYAYVVTPKRIDVQKLLSDVPSLLAPDTFGKLPEISRYDLSEAGKCIAFERPTAAAFHILRATESVLRQFYCTKIRRNRCGLLWGPIIDSLRSKRRLKRFAPLFNNLDDIRLSFRNPTQHPEKQYDIHEVQDLWARCVDALNRMAKDLPDIEKTRI